MKLPSYRPYGQPAVCYLHLEALPEVDDTVTIGGLAFAYGPANQFWGNSLYEIARSLTAAINSEREEYGHRHRSLRPVQTFFAIQYGTWIALIATFPGTDGNALTTATSNTTAFVFTGATFSGGTTQSQGGGGGSQITIGTVDEPEGNVLGNAVGDIYVQLDALGRVAAIWFFNGTPGTDTGWTTTL